MLNLECCISDRGERRRQPGKPFFFRAPPAATGLLTRLGVDCVTLANNHALDYGAEALLDTLAHLRAAGIAAVGAGLDREQARAPVTLQADGFRLAVLGCSDHPREYAAGPATPGIAYGLDWVADAIETVEADAVLVTPHWGPNMAATPLPLMPAALLRTPLRVTMCTSQPSFSARTIVPLRSTLGPRKPKSTAVWMVWACGSAAGEEDWVTVNGADPGLPLPVMLSATQVPGVSSVCTVPGALASTRKLP